MKHEGLIDSAAGIGVPLDESQAARLERFEALLAERAAALGMIASGDLPRLRERHIIDSLRAASGLPAGIGTVLDLGSGAGLPGIPLAIARPELAVTLAETRQQRIAFLELASADLRLEGVSVHGGRAEDASGPFDACLARAFRDAAGSWKVARPLLAEDGCLLYFAGARFDPGRDVPAEASASVVPTSSLANGGPLVIMTRQ